MDNSIKLKKSKSPIIFIVVIAFVVLTAAIICVIVLQHDDSNIPANDTNDIAARQTDPNRPFVGIIEKDIKSAYITESYHGDAHLSTDDIHTLLTLASQMWIDTEKGEKMSRYLGGPCVIHIDLKDGRTLSVGGYSGLKENSNSKYFYNGLEYDGNYDLCEKFEMLIDDIREKNPEHQKWLAEMSEKIEKEEKGEYQQN